MHEGQTREDARELRSGLTMLFVLLNKKERKEKQKAEPWKEWAALGTARGGGVILSHCTIFPNVNCLYPTPR